MFWKSREKATVRFRKKRNRHSSRASQPNERSLRVEELEDRRLLATFLVENLNDSGAGSLRAAVNEANSNAGEDEIIFVGDAASGTILLTTGELEIRDPLVVTGSGQDQLTIDAGQNSRVMNILGFRGDVSINRLTLTGGNSFSDGGGVNFDSRGTLTFAESTIAGNQTNGSGANGGGIYAEAGAVVLNQSTVRDNYTSGRSSGGGGIYVRGGSVRLVDSTVSGNSTLGTGSRGVGGGIRAHTVSVYNSVVSENSTVGFDAGGGGIYASSVVLVQSVLADNSTAGDFADGGGMLSGSVVLNQSTVSGNSTLGRAARGGGIRADSGTVAVTSSTVSGNAAVGRYGEAGGIFVVSGSIILSDSTVTDNIAADRGGGIVTRYSSLTIQNSIVAGNVAEVAPDLTHSLTITPTVTFSLIGSNTGTTLTPAVVGAPDAMGNMIGSQSSPIDPLLAPLADIGGPTPAHSLLAGSPAVDTGNSDLAVDQLGLDRLVDHTSAPNAVGTAGTDIGAVELPSLAGIFLPTDIDVAFGSPSDLDLSSALLVDETNGTLIVTLSVISGTFSPPADGSGLNVVEMQSDPQAISLTGRAVDLNRYLDTASNLSYTPSAGNGGDNADAIEVMIIDGSMASDTGTIHIDIFEPSSLVVTTAVDQIDKFDFATSLREALSLANATPGKDTVRFAESLSGQTISINDGQAFRISDALEIDATSLVEPVTIDAQEMSRVFTVDDLLTSDENFDVAIAGLTITGGYEARDGGGGILFRSAGLLSLNQSSISGNYAERGGGVYTRSGSVTLNLSVVRSNSAAAGGGGLFASNFGSITLSSSVVIENSTIDPDGEGGGISTYGLVVLDRSTVNNNSTEGSTARGGGIFAGTFTASNSTVSGNRTVGSSADGGGVYSRSLTLDRSTVYGNIAVGDSARGGGVRVSGPSILRNSIISDNFAGFAPDIRAVHSVLPDVTYSLIGNATDSGITEGIGVGNLLNLSALLGPLANNGGLPLPGGATMQTHALLPGSPALDAGDSRIAFDPMDFDQRGMPFVRVNQGVVSGVFMPRIDIGAFESQGPPSADFNADSIVSGIDFLHWQRGFGATSGAIIADGDSDRDGDVDASDLTAWRASYGETTFLPPSPAVRVDEESFMDESSLSDIASAKLVDAAMAMSTIEKEQARHITKVANSKLNKTIFLQADPTIKPSSYFETTSGLAAAIVDSESLKLSSGKAAHEPDLAWLSDEILERVFG